MKTAPASPPPLPRKRPPRFPPPPEPSDPAGLGKLALTLAGRHGFCAAGVLSAPKPLTWDRFWNWVAAGYAGEMDWLARDAAARQDFSHILPFTRSVLAVALLLPPGGPGNVARYARGDDYHVTVRRALHRIAAELAKSCPEGTHFRVCVDTAPLLEREVAVRAGLGFIGKNGMLIIPGVGSHTVLGELLTDVDLGPSSATVPEPAETSFSECGSCTACLDGCPTSAFKGPGLLDARLCLSYLTIEKRSDFEGGEADAIGETLFGCDICQDVCPWNGPPLKTAAAQLDPGEIASLTEEEFDARFSHTALTRAGWRGLARNARAVLANRGKS
ncbi:MAG: tRNA epoxyqueuosine(34) reductase QueG [Thermoanaerobaculia bacterium]|nr:tRNA epoxyqueuosine(34) reductase QueG [Thermoanaerobaculia bacterium]